MNEYLLKIKDSALNIKQPCLVSHVAAVKNNLLNLLNYRNYGFLVADSPLEKITSGDFTYHWKFPIYDNVKYLDIFLHGIFWIYSESGSSTHNLVVTARTSAGSTLDTRTMLIPDNSDAVSTYYDGKESLAWIRLDVSDNTGTSMIVTVAVPDDMFFGAISVFSQGENTIDYNDYNDINGVGTIHDEGITALFTKLGNLKNYKRIINTWSRNKAAISATAAKLFDVDCPIQGKQFGSDSSEVFTSYIYINSISSTVGIKPQIFDIDGNLHWEDSLTNYTSTGWKTLTWGAADHGFDRDFDLDYYYNLYVDASGGSDSIIIRSVTTYC